LELLRRISFGRFGSHNRKTIGLPPEPEPINSLSKRYSIIKEHAERQGQFVPNQLTAGSAVPLRINRRD
jgi:hypothetical protein